jgi:hypothetical protein
MWQHVLAQALDSVPRDPWADEFFGLDQEQRFVVLLVVAGCLAGMIITLAQFVYRGLDAAHRRRTEADLKREMLDRGMSVDEIVKVIEAAPPPEDAAGRWIASWCKSRK